MTTSSLPESLLEIREHGGPGYKPLIDYQSWRAALMNYTPDLLPEKIDRMQKHTETDEVFVLLAGHCILFLGEGGEAAAKIHAVDMELYKSWFRVTLAAASPIISSRRTTASCSRGSLENSSQDFPCIYPSAARDDSKISSK